jgi:hypothetical protein
MKVLFDVLSALTLCVRCVSVLPLQCGPRTSLESDDTCSQILIENYEQRSLITVKSSAESLSKVWMEAAVCVTWHCCICYTHKPQATHSLPLPVIRCDVMWRGIRAPVWALHNLCLVVDIIEKERVGEDGRERNKVSRRWGERLR